MRLVSDVHGAFDALGRVAAEPGPLLILGDLVNLIDYRTNVGIIPDIVGTDLIAATIDARMQGDDEGAQRIWQEGVALLDFDVREEVARSMVLEYRQMHEVLAGSDAYVIHGNVDDPQMLRDHLPSGCSYVDGEVVGIDGRRVGFVGGGIPRIGSRGEIDDETMRTKLAALGDVDILCTHVAPAISMLAEDVIGGSTKGSIPVAEYIRDIQPSFHYFGDVHQPRAVQYRLGSTLCTNVGYFRATGRAHHHAP